VADAQRIGLDPEPQVAAHYVLGLAWGRWPADPRGAMDGVARWLEGGDGLKLARAIVSLELLRMALRLSDPATLAIAAEAHRGARLTPLSGLHASQARWVDALALDDRLGVEGAATELERSGFRWAAADAWADAALMAARGGEGSKAGQRASELCVAMGLHPLLGPLPESRWIQADAAEVAAT
jgi:hypothetical protein